MNPIGYHIAIRGSLDAFIFVLLKRCTRPVQQPVVKFKPTNCVLTCKELEGEAVARVNE